MKLVNIAGFEVVKIYVPVEYEAVDEIVSRIWKEHDPEVSQSLSQNFH